MRVLIAINHPKTDLGTVGMALREAGAEMDIVRCNEGEVLPEDHSAHDALVIYGGAQNALADDTHPYLPHLTGLARAFGEADKAVLGICLGSQIVARAYGGRNVIGNPLEFGWQPIRATDAGRADPVASVINGATHLFEWHNDTFDLPPGAVHLAENDHTRHQAFRIGRAVYACQFHFEAHRGVVADWKADYEGMIERDVPGWLASYEDHAATLGAVADEAGLAIARAWVGLIRPAS